MRKLENLYAGMGVPKLVGGIDIEWAAAKRERSLQIKSNGETVCFIDLDVLLNAHKERKMSCCFDNHSESVLLVSTPLPKVLVETNKKSSVEATKKIEPLIT